MLSYTHAGLYYVYYIVAEFLAFLDDIIYMVPMA